MNLQKIELLPEIPYQECHRFTVQTKVGALVCFVHGIRKVSFKTADSHWKGTPQADNEIIVNGCNYTIDVAMEFNGTWERTFDYIRKDKHDSPSDSARKKILAAIKEFCETELESKHGQALIDGNEVAKSEHKRHGVSKYNQAATEFNKASATLFDIL